MVVGGYPRFQYHGYWLSVVDPWPGDWGDDWHDNDQVYVDDSDGGYYLYNRRYPGVGTAVSISMWMDEGGGSFAGSDRAIVFAGSAGAYQEILVSGVSSSMMTVVPVLRAIVPGTTSGSSTSSG